MLGAPVGAASSMPPAGRSRLVLNVMSNLNPYESPSADTFQAKTTSAQPSAVLCGSAKAVLCCLSVHAFAMVRFFFFSLQPDWFDALVAAFLVVSTVVGVACSISAIRQVGIINRVVGICGVLYFAFYILLAIAES